MRSWSPEKLDHDQASIPKETKRLNGSVWNSDDCEKREKGYEMAGKNAKHPHLHSLAQNS